LSVVHLEVLSVLILAVEVLSAPYLSEVQSLSIQAPKVLTTHGAADMFLGFQLVNEERLFALEVTVANLAVIMVRLVDLMRYQGSLGAKYVATVFEGADKLGRHGGRHHGWSIVCSLCSGELKQRTDVEACRGSEPKGSLSK
jgi:hypothetical protein